MLCVSAVFIISMVIGCEVVNKNSDIVMVERIKKSKFEDSLRHEGRMGEMKFEKELKLKLIEKGASTDANLTY